MARDEIHAIVQRIDNGKPEPGDVEALQQAVGQSTGPAALAGRALVKHAIRAMQSGRAVQTIMAAEVQQLRESFGYSRSTGVERELIDHVALCWLRLQLAEHALSQTTSGQHALEEGRYREQRLTEAQVRYLRAVGLLERLRRHAPTVQVNIAQQQIVHNAGAGAPSVTADGSQDT